ncbi:hypothetical protein BH10PSE3_BH10PSE3_15660 [soil metagenome]
MRLKVEATDKTVGYLYLSRHPGPGTPGCVARTLRLHDLVPDYRGADIHIDLDASGEAIGIEVLE